MRIVDLSNRRKPVVVGAVATISGTTQEDVVVQQIDTEFFQGDLLAVGIQACVGVGFAARPRGVDYAGNDYSPNIAAGRPMRGEEASLLAEGSRLLGTRPKLRFFGSWELSDALLRDTDWVRRAYQQAVPMGGDLPAAPAHSRAPTFAIWAVKDSSGGNLDWLQIVKVWEEGRSHAERVYDVAWSGAHERDPKTGALPAVGNTVDLATATYTNAIGTAERRLSGSGLSRERGRGAVATGSDPPATLLPLPGSSDLAQTRSRRRSPARFSACYFGTTAHTLG